MKFGKFEIKAFVEQHFKLDGGMMFGIIPKVIWHMLIPSDDSNFIPMTTNIFVLSAHGKNMIFDCGLGDTLTDKEKVIYNTYAQSAMDLELEKMGLSNDDIDYVILTHLHTDHAGGVVKFKADHLEPRFKKAKYIVSKEEWRVAMNPNERTAAVYNTERLNVIKRAGLLELIEPDTELFPGIKAVHTGGHSEGHFGLELESEGKRIFYYADIFPTASHMSVAYIPATDVFPLSSMEVKRNLLPRLLEPNTLIALDHDDKITFGKVTQEGRKYKVLSVNNFI